MGIAISAGEREFDHHRSRSRSAFELCNPALQKLRQMLFEYCPDIKVIVNDENGNLIKAKARDLLPLHNNSLYEKEK